MLYLPKSSGQGLVEYALILVLVAVVVIVILALLGPAIGNVFSGIVEVI
jgi:pilus assembly protein Flp/PilA